MIMSRDELILSFSDVVDNLVKKYNDGKLDEDLHNEGMIKVIKAVDKCLEEGVTERDSIIGRVIFCVSNALLDLKRKPKLIFVDDLDLDEGSYDIEYEQLVIDACADLKGLDREIFIKRLNGESAEKIITDLKISRQTYFNHLSKIKNYIIQND